MNTLLKIEKIGLEEKGYFVSLGKVNLNCVPSPNLLSKVIVPPCASTKRLTTANPKPCPLDLVVMRGWKIFGFISSGMPTPVSITVMETVPCNCRVLQLGKLCRLKLESLSLQDAYSIQFRMGLRRKVQELFCW